MLLLLLLLLLAMNWSTARRISLMSLRSLSLQLVSCTSQVLVYGHRCGTVRCWTLDSVTELLYVTSRITCLAYAEGLAEISLRASFCLSRLTRKRSLSLRKKKWLTINLQILRIQAFTLQACLGCSFENSRLWKSSFINFDIIFFKVCFI